MSEISEIIDFLENRIERLFIKVNSLEKASISLKAQLENASTVILKQSEDIVNLKLTEETLKMANSLLGGEENKRDTKLKINSLIREIDYCIAQLSD